jgi:type II secretory pathway pseudopilin PulG
MINTSHMASGIRSARKRGVTLIEAVLFISIALGLIVGGLVFFQQASLAQRTADAVRNVSSMASETRALYRAQSDFTGISKGVLINAGAVPSNIVNTADNTLSNEWGGDITIDPNGDGVPAAGQAAASAFIITYTGIPREACVRLGTYDSSGSGVVGSGIIGIRVGSTGAYDVDGVTPADIIGYCTSDDDNDLAWVFGR